MKILLLALLLSLAATEISFAQDDRDSNDEPEATELDTPRTPPPPPAPLVKPRSIKVVTPKIEQNPKSTSGDAEEMKEPAESEPSTAPKPSATNRHDADPDDVRENGQPLPFLPKLRSVIPQNTLVFRFRHRKWERVTELDLNRLYFAVTRNDRMLTRSVRSGRGRITLEMKPLTPGTTVVGYMGWQEGRYRTSLMEFDSIDRRNEGIVWKYYRVAEGEHPEEFIYYNYTHSDEDDYEMEEEQDGGHGHHPQHPGPRGRSANAAIDPTSAPKDNKRVPSLKPSVE